MSSTSRRAAPRAGGIGSAALTNPGPIGDVHDTSAVVQMADGDGEALANSYQLRCRYVDFMRTLIGWDRE